MPFIHIKSLPFDQSLDAPTVIEGLARDFASATGIALEHVTVTWDYLPSGHYAVAGKTAAYQPRDSHPFLVDLLTPDFNSPEIIEKMLTVVAQSIARHTNMPIHNIFIYHRQARSGSVFDAGEIVRW